MATQVINHPLILDKLTRMRKKETSSKIFKESLDEVTRMIAYEIFRDLKLEAIPITTPVAKSIGYKVDENIVLVPILRAGLGMVDSVINLVPNAKIGHIGLYRDSKTLLPKEYFVKKPINDINDSYVLILDPVLATGGSASKAIEIIKSWNAKKIKLICVIAAPEGIKKIEKDHPNIDIYLAAIDERLNEKGYIVPGLGDAGDRIFGTE